MNDPFIFYWWYQLADFVEVESKMWLVSIWRREKKSWKVLETTGEFWTLFILRSVESSNQRHPVF